MGGVLSSGPHEPRPPCALVRQEEKKWTTTSARRARKHVTDEFTKYYSFCRGANEAIISTCCIWPPRCLSCRPCNALSWWQLFMLVPGDISCAKIPIRYGLPTQGKLLLTLFVIAIAGTVWCTDEVNTKAPIDIIHVSIIVSGTLITFCIDNRAWSSVEFKKWTRMPVRLLRSSALCVRSRRPNGRDQGAPYTESTCLIMCACIKHWMKNQSGAHLLSAISCDWSMPSAAESYFVMENKEAHFWC